MRKLVKNSILMLLALVLTVTFSIPVYASEDVSYGFKFNNDTTTSGSLCLDDKAGLLNKSEASELVERLEVASDKNNYTFAIITTNDLQGVSIETYANNYYNSAIKGKNPSDDYVLLTVDMGSRKVNVRSMNLGSNRNLIESECSDIREYITSDLTGGYYYDAFSGFLNKSVEMVQKVDGTLPFPWLKALAISLVIGLVLSFIIVMILKKQLKSVAMRPDASDYIRPDSLNIKSSHDFFLYSTVTKTAKPKNNDSGGGSRSSGGSSTGSF